MALKSRKTFSPDCGLIPGLYAFSSPSPLRSVLTLCPPWPTVELSLHYPRPTESSSHACPPPHRLLFPCPNPTPRPLLTPLLGHRSDSSSSTALCTATLSSRPLPAARLLIGIGGKKRIAVRHSCPLELAEPGQGHSHHSCAAAAAHSKQGETRARDAWVKGKRDKSAAEWGFAVEWDLTNWRELQSITYPEFILFLKLVIRRKASEYYHHITCLFTPFDEIFRHVTVFVCKLIGNLFSALSLINTHQ